MTIVRSLAAAQTIPKRGDVDANIQHHVRLVRAAADERVELLVFPELSLTGYELDLADGLAFSEDDPRLLPLVDVAASCAMTLVVGAPIRLGAELHIGAFIVTLDAKLEVYTKRQLGAFSKDVSPDGIVPPAEDTVFRPGAKNPIIRFHGNSAAVGICAETLGEVHPRQAADQGAKIYLTSHFGIPLDVGFRAMILRGHAVRHSMAVVFANYGGPTGGLPAGGKSAIWSESGELLAELEATGAGVAIASENQTGWCGKTVVLADP